MLFRKKPVVIDAVQWTGTNTAEVLAFAEPNVGVSVIGGQVMIPTLEGLMRGDEGDWLIRGVKGELYPCKPDIFAATYEPATTPATVGGQNPFLQVEATAVRPTL